MWSRDRFFFKNCDFFLRKMCPCGLWITSEMGALICTQSSPCLEVNFSGFLWAFGQFYTDLVVGLNLAKAGGVLIATTEQPFGRCEMRVVKVPSARQTFIHWECIKKVFINWSLCWHLWQSSQKLSMNRHSVSWGEIYWQVPVKTGIYFIHCKQGRKGLSPWKQPGIKFTQISFSLKKAGNVTGTQAITGN